MSVDAYAVAGREIEVPRPKCPSCSAPMAWWSGYRRYVRHGGSCHRIFVRRVRCRPCQQTHALLPAFVLFGRLDVVESVGAVIAAATSDRLGSAEREMVVRQIAGRVHDHPDGSSRRYSGGTIDRWIPPTQTI